MEGDARRRAIIAMLIESKSPISGAEFARKLGVSRQVIVQDIALLRANNKNILSTTRGYVVHVPEIASTRVKRTFAVNHENTLMRDELYLITDCGGTVLDVVVEHDVYGQITCELMLSNRREVDQFIDRIATSRSRSLSSLTQGDHFHTVEAQSIDILNEIEQKLRDAGILKE